MTTNYLLDAQHVPPKTKEHIQRNLNFAITQFREFDNLARFWNGEIKKALEELESFPCLTSPNIELQSDDYETFSQND